MAPTRIYPIPPITPLLALLRNARSEVEEFGLPAMTQFLQCMRRRIVRYVDPLYCGLRCPVLSRDEYLEYALITIAAQLELCTAETDDALFAWISARTHAAMLELHAFLHAGAHRRRQVPSPVSGGLAA